MNTITVDKIIPSFSIYRADGSKVPTLKKSFLVKEIIDDLVFSNKVIELDDGTEWKLICEPSVITTLKASKQQAVFCIVSYQVHTHGNYAIARLVKEKPTKDIVQKDLSHWIFGKVGIL